MINEELLHHDLRNILLYKFKLTKEETESLIWSNPTYSRGIFLNLFLVREIINRKLFR